MTRTNIDLDDAARDTVMRRYHLSTEKEAVNFALRALAADTLDFDSARGLRGSGWDGDLDEMRAGRVGCPRRYLGVGWVSPRHGQHGVRTGGRAFRR